MADMVVEEHFKGVYQAIGGEYFAILRLKVGSVWRSVRVPNQRTAKECYDVRVAAQAFWERFEEMHPTKRLKAIRLYLRGARDSILWLSDSDSIRIPRNPNVEKLRELHYNLAVSIVSLDSPKAKRDAAEKLIQQVTGRKVAPSGTDS